MSEETMFKKGQVIGPYKIICYIGCGGMGEVYEVEHESFGVHYALKAFVYRGGKSWPMLRAKFMEEGQVLVRFGKWSEDGQFTGKKVIVDGLPMPRASGVVGLCSEGPKASPLHFVVGRILPK